jgi:hypothetical protein
MLKLALIIKILKMLWGSTDYPTEMRMEILLSCAVDMDLLLEVPYFLVRIFIRLLGCDLLLKIRWKIR